jgi:hypothetical protein
VSHWIPSYQDVGAHPKTRKLAARLDVDIPKAVGLLHLLWWWALSYAPDGDLTKHDAEDVAIGMMWDGDPRALLEALVASRWIDRNGTGVALHDWDEYGGMLIERRRADAARKAEERARKKEEKQTNKEDHPRTSAGRPSDGRRTGVKTPKNSDETPSPYATSCRECGSSTRSIVDGLCSDCRSAA